MIFFIPSQFLKQILTSEKKNTFGAVIAVSNIVDRDRPQQNMRMRLVLKRYTVGVNNPSPQKSNSVSYLLS